VFISDLHFGLGHVDEAKWDPYEDFRWNDALSGFLTHLDSTYKSRVDLIVLGDFMEMWQHPLPSNCQGPTKDHGCSVAEARDLAHRIALAHQDSLKQLSVFAKKGENHLYLVPGNHDAALLLPAVWAEVEKVLGGASDQITLVTQGMWQSPDGLLLAEHGHQIGKDVNKYDTWTTVTEIKKSTEYLLKTWGEQFVQKVFNETEREYSIIDNLSPESVGVRYRIADRGYIKSARDIAKFLAFNLFETSVKQRGQVLDGAPAHETSKPKWNIDYAKNTLGYRLIAGALPAGDPLLDQINANDEMAKQLQEQLSLVVADLSETDVEQLCDHLAIQGRVACLPPTMGALRQALFNTKEAVIRKHLKERRKSHKSFRYFIYGHTHQLETPWEVQFGAYDQITVANTGAFHRVVDEKGFKRRMNEKGLTSDKALKSIQLADLPPCYTFVLVDANNPSPIQTLRWAQAEGSKGRVVQVSNVACD
jgi:UDP-2,3-diacylglucosamine pyrophosphatase LpxH